MTRPTRVLVIIDSFSFGGAENLLAVLSRAAPSVGIELRVASLAPRSQGRLASLPVLQDAGLEPTFLDVARLADPTAVFRVARAISDSGCDVVHAHLGYSAIVAPPAARLAGRPCVTTLHHVPEDLSRREHVKERLSVGVAGRLGRLLFVSEASRREFARRYRERDTWSTVYNGVDLTAFSPGDATWPTDLPLAASDPVVTIVAALRQPKGHRVAVDAWRQVVDRIPQARLLVVGDGPERPRLESQVAERGLVGRVIFAGARQDVPRLLRASTLAALPSFTEALPTSLIEAAACGLPAVATRVGGVAEVVEDGVSGLLVPRGDAGAFADAVASLLRDPERCAALGSAGRVLAEQRFDMHRWARVLRGLYDELSRGGAVRVAVSAR